MRAVEDKKEKQINYIGFSNRIYMYNGRQSRRKEIAEKQIKKVFGGVRNC